MPAGRLRATTDYADAVPGADAVVVVVPLFVDDATWQPDFGWMDSATRSIGENLTRGTLVSYETTLPVGTTRGTLEAACSRSSPAWSRAPTSTWCSPPSACSPAGSSPTCAGTPSWSAGSRRRARPRRPAFYRATLDFDERPDLSRPNGVWDLGSAEAAEMAKLAETTYRDVNIGLANQFGRFAEKHGIDVHAVIEASNSQPYSHIHRPGIAVGGHCIPVYPRLYLFNDPDATIVRAAREANMAMPSHAIDLARVASGGSLDGLRLVVLGASYRGGVKETAFSGVFATVDAARAAGADVFVHDPMYTDAELEAFGWAPYHLGEPVDVAVVQADHEAYRTMTAADLPGVRVLVDGRRVTSDERWAGVERVVLGAA